MKTDKFKGVFPPMVTFFDEKGDIDWEANQQLTDWLIDKKVNGLLLMGSTGEFSALTIEERLEFAKKMITYVNGRVPVIIGVGSTSFRETLKLTTHAEGMGADALIVMNPYYWNYSEDQLYHYFLEISNSTSLPVILYNIPQLTGQTLSVELIAKLAAADEKIIGIKETVADIGHIRKVLLEVRKVRPDFLVFAAFDDHILPALEIGATGSINGTAVFAPELAVEIYESYKEGHIQDAITAHNRLTRLMSIYDFMTPFYLGIKEAVNQRVLGRRTGARFPVLPTDELTKKSIHEFLKENGWL